MNVTAVNNTWSIVTAPLTDGASLQAQFAGGAPPTYSVLTPQLSLAAASPSPGPYRLLCYRTAFPLPESVGRLANRVRQRHRRQGPAAALTNSSGIATNTLTVGPLAKGQTASINACLNGTSRCVALPRPPTERALSTLSSNLSPGTSQSLAATGTPSQIVLRLLDMDGNPMAGGTVALYQALYAWSPPCSPNTVCTQGALLHANLHGYLRRRRPAIFPARLAARRSHQSPRPLRLRQHGDREHLD